MKKKIKEIIKYSLFPLIMCMITMLIGIFLFVFTAIGLPIKEVLTILLISFLPFLVFLLITILTYHFKDKKKRIFKIITIFLTFSLIIYYFISLFVCILLSAVNPITDPKYYKYYVSGERLEKVFPSNIPSNAENVSFHYSPGFLQAGTNYSLYYIDKDMTKNKFDEKYKDKAIWIGYKDEYTEKQGLLTGVFAYTPAYYENEEDYIIYLIEGRCDDSGYCNHGDFLIAAFNEKTKEVVFSSEQW